MYDYASSVYASIRTGKCASECQSDNPPIRRLELFTLGPLRNETTLIFRSTRQSDTSWLGTTTKKNTCGVSMRSNDRGVVHLPLRTPCLHVDVAPTLVRRLLGSAAESNGLAVNGGPVPSRENRTSKRVATTLAFRRFTVGHCRSRRTP